MLALEQLAKKCPFSAGEEGGRPTAPTPSCLRAWKSQQVELQSVIECTPKLRSVAECGGGAWVSTDRARRGVKGTDIESASSMTSTCTWRRRCQRSWRHSCCVGRWATRSRGTWRRCHTSSSV